MLVALFAGKEVKITTPDEVDCELLGWLQEAYARGEDGVPIVFRWVGVMPLGSIPP